MSPIRFLANESDLLPPFTVSPTSTKPANASWTTVSPSTAPHATAGWPLSGPRTTSRSSCCRTDPRCRCRSRGLVCRMLGSGRWFFGGFELWSEGVWSKWGGRLWTPSSIRAVNFQVSSSIEKSFSFHTIQNTTSICLLQLGRVDRNVIPDFDSTSFRVPEKHLPASETKQSATQPISHLKPHTDFLT